MAADIKTIGCVEHMISAIDRARIDAEFEKGIRGSDDFAGLSDAWYVQIVMDASAKCKRQYGWSNDADDMAFAYTDGMMGLAAFRRVANAQGLDVPRIERIWDALPATTRTTLFPETGAGFGELANTAYKAGLIRTDHEVYLAVGIFASRNIIDTRARAFAEA